MLRTLDGNLLTAFTLGAFKTKYQLLGGLCVLPQDGFGMTSENLLFAIVTPTSLCKLRFLWLFVLGHFKLLMSITGRTVSLPRLGNIHLKQKWQFKNSFPFSVRHVFKNQNKFWIAINTQVKNKSHDENTFPKVNCQP